MKPKNLVEIRTWQHVTSEIEYHRDQIRLLEKAKSTAILSAGELLITVMHRDKKLFQR